MHMLSRHELFDALMLYAFTVPVIVVSAILAVLSIFSLVLWAIGGMYQVPG